MNRLYGLCIVLLLVIVLLGIFETGEAQPTVKLEIDPDIRSLTIGTDPQEIAITTRTTKQNVQFFWSLDGPGELIGDVTSPGILYVAPEHLAGASAEAVVTVTVTDDQGQKTTEHVKFTLHSTQSPPTQTDISSTTSMLTLRDEVSGMEMIFVNVAGGNYDMGCGSWANQCGTDEKLHPVQVQEFWIGQFEVTRIQWRQVMEGGAQSSGQDDRLPVDNVSWIDAQAFLEKLSANMPGYVFRLPTEVEWEFACRSGGKPENYAGGAEPDAVAWYKNNSDRQLHLVGDKQPNGLDLYDMSGNVREWTLDWYAADYSNPPSGATKVARGGGWVSAAKYIRCTNREQYLPDIPKAGIGFRVVMEKKP